MSKQNRTRRVGINERVDATGRKQYRGHAYDRRAKQKIRGPWTYSLAAAKAWRTDALAQLDAGTLSAHRGELIAAAADAFIGEMKVGSARTRSGDAYKPSAVRDYERGFRLRIVPAIGGSRMADVRTSDLQRLVARLQGEGLDPSTIRNTMNALRSLYRHSVALGRCHDNPTQGSCCPPSAAGATGSSRPTSPSGWWLRCLSPSGRCGRRRSRPGCAAANCKRSAGSTLILTPARSACMRAGTSTRARSTPSQRAGWRTVPMTGDLHVILAEHRRRSQRIAGLVFGRTPELPFSPATATDRAKRAWKARRTGADRAARSASHLRELSDRRGPRDESDRHVHGAQLGRVHLRPLRAPAARLDGRERGQA